MPDEYIPDYSLSQEEEQKRYNEHLKKSKKAWAKLEKLDEKPKKME